MRSPRFLCTATAWEGCFSRTDSPSRLVDGVNDTHYNLTQRRGRVKTELLQTPLCNTTDMLRLNWASAFFNFTPKRITTKEDLEKKKKGFFFLQFATRERWSTYAGQLHTVFCGSTSCFLSLTNDSPPEKRAGSFITQTTTSSQQRKKKQISATVGEMVWERVEVAKKERKHT